MRMLGFLALAAILPLTLWAALPVLEPGAYYSPVKFVVKFCPGAVPANITAHNGLAQTGIAAVDALSREFQVSRIEKLFPGSLPGTGSVDLSGYFVFHFEGSDQARLETVLERYARLPQVEHAEPVDIHPVNFTPNDPLFSAQWYHNQSNDCDLDSPEGWDVQRGDSLPIIGIADTGVLWTHPDLAGNLWINWPEWNGQPGVDDDGDGYVDDIRGWDWVNVNAAWPGEDYTVPDNDPSDFSGHGTEVAGVAAAVTGNGLGISGVAGGSYPLHGARIMPLRIGWSANNQGEEVSVVDMSFAVQAFYYAANKGATVINCSWPSSFSTFLQQATDYVTAAGVVIVTSAGNSNNQTPSYLASRSEVIAVAATDQNDHKASFSSFGTWVDVSAPGISIQTTSSNHTATPYTPAYALPSGTSFAAPMVSGLVAILKSQHPLWNRAQITWQILNTTDNLDALNPSYEGLLGTGRINVNNALIGGTTAQITVNSPNGNDPAEYWVVGHMYNITWSSLFLTGGVTIRLNRNYPNGPWETLFSNVINTGSQAWIVSGTTSAACRIRVEAGNDSTIYDVSNNNFNIGAGTGQEAGAPVVLFSEGFNGSFNSGIYDRGDGNTVSGVDFWDTRSSQPHSGSKSCYCAGYGTPAHPPYDNDMVAYLYQKSTCGVNVTGYSNVTFSFWIWYDTDGPGDYLKAQYFTSSMGWQDLPNGLWWGNSDGWIHKVYDVTGLGNFRFRFQFTTDASGTAEGAYLDDIVIMGVPAASNLGPNDPGVVDLTPGAALPGERTGAQDPGGSPLPAAFELAQNTPNPFNPVTVISYQLPAFSPVNLKVYDITGRLVATLVDGRQEAGVHIVSFDGSALAAGMYFIRMQAGDFRAARKILLLK